MKQPVPDPAGPSESEVAPAAGGAGGARAFDELTALFRAGRHADLERAATDLLRAEPGNGALWKALGVARGALGKQEEALAAKLRAAELLPHDAEAHCNLGNALRERRDVAAAEAAFRRALAIAPGFTNAWGGLGALLGETGRLREAIDCLRRLCELRPESAQARNELGNLLREAGRMNEARAAYEQALALRPRFPEALSNLGNTLADLGRVREAESRYREALALQPGRGQIFSNLGNLLKQQGRLDEAQAAYREAVRLDPEFAGARSNLLLALNHDARLSPLQAKAQALRFGEFAAARAAGSLVPHTQPHRGGPLRVGLVSGDLRQHPVGYFLEGVLAALDPAQIEVLAYATVAREDALTARLKPRLTRWRCIATLGDEEAARLIRADGVDILLDLAGHTAYNRLGVFAWRPAPVQASWLGYFATTGLAAMDWVIADAASVPPQHEAHFVERIWRLPHTRLCFTPPAGAPETAPLPALAGGGLTFGSFQNLGKINDEVLSVWGRVLAAVPGSRLRLQNGQLGDAQMRQQLLERLRVAGIASQAVTMHGRTSRNDYLRSHAEVDILLDTFPYPGGTTTCEALWMGVPTLTLAGDRMLSRQGASLLQAAGLPQWIAADRQEYVERATRHAAGLHALAELRQVLREQVRRSPLFDAPLFARHLTEALREMASSTPRAH